jgi:methylated-DNA-protein-cysteine methyltransferase-like protein
VVADSFFRRVYQIVRQIPPGSVATYGQIAHLLGEPHAARTVGWAMSVSSDSYVPWHRVLNAQGRISAAERRAESGLQRALLEEEGVVFDEDGRVDLAAYQWEAPSDLAERLAPD